MASIFKQTAETERHGIVYPERVILANLSHGSITIKKDETEKTFVMPEGITVKRAWASVPGVCNFIHPETNAYFVRTIKSYKHRLQTMPFEDVDRQIQTILNTFKKYDRENVVEDMRSLVQNRNTLTLTAQDFGLETEQEKQDYIDEAKKYFDTYEQFFQISTYLPGDTVIDKMYSRTNTEAVNRPHEKQWVSLLINVKPGTLDLITLMKPQTRKGESFVYLSQIIDELKTHGVSEVIIFDNSCSVFLDEEGTEYLDRSIRRRRRGINTDSTIKFGGKKYKSYKKRKSIKKKTKKRRF